MSDLCISGDCGHEKALHDPDGYCLTEGCHCERFRDEPTDDEIYNRPGVEGGIRYPMDDAPGSLGENDWRL